MKAHLREKNLAYMISALLLALSLGVSSFLFWNVKTHAEDLLLRRQRVLFRQEQPMS